MTRDHGPGHGCCALALAALCWPTDAAAQALAAPSGAASIDYTAPPACPNANDFVRAVEARTTRRGKSADPRRFVVRLELLQTGARGSLRILGPHELGGERVLHADTCAELMDALAFVVATLMTPGEPGDQRPPKQPSSPPVATAPAPAREASSLWRFGGGISLGVYTALAPEVLPGARVVLRAERTRRVDHHVTLTAQISVARAISGRLNGTLGDAELTWLAGRGELCGPRWGSAVGVSACGLLDVGRLTGVGFARFDPATKSALWFSPGALGRFELRVANTLCVFMDGGATLPLSRPRFFLAGPRGEETVQEVPVLASFGELGVLALLP